ncbi:MAG: 50S ribosomal protein L17 [Candidatus Yanofskybacteria bacterium GW2011_GWA2_41_22]|uniref:50S ribosomal protein L17 n=5 Tax=Parcubacteria group TaxID=1794811 RepID=A0A1F8HW14_9BACT|nr:MAG: 50S ribosomal protein L17 [Candidatus Yanofskybacteria bacterium GW2011_GWA2_41_22]KKS25020.1 MAG: 50S ribosomal protein L17 [Candidatus Jorgensenbacteria bacterium GW2011_GWF2_41_8]KKS27119.1 MAG: 50S ribosomal protein L17 [Candidatus Yanofskybacteria bacterium GW2011_GWC2_41_9]OGM99081.1 MAG: 50S ribosomal protein L17 [Candidatus Yanofskybacteria bacterium RIFCSPHIGHO2_01_FULL_41_27]OGN09013.1 MAG: 50S ribosomal protein L17 [Candidatus Yanofskybacteria bacterium RIFCSPHIGHO2_02_FULL_4
MRRGNKTKFGRETSQRKALSKSLATALINHGKIKTTEAKAKTLSQFVQKLITIAKKQNVASRRLLLKQIGEEAAKKLVSDTVLNFKDKNGGYTRITRLGQRKSDSAPMVLIEFNL